MKRMSWLSAMMAVWLLFAGCASAPTMTPSQGFAPADAAPATSGGAADEEMARPGGTASDVDMQQRMVIQNATMELLVKDTEQSQQSINMMADELKGYILSSDRSKYGNGLSIIVITIKIPAENFNTAMTRLRGLAVDVQQESVSSSDVTQEYVDLKSRLRALESKAARLEELMKQAEDTNAVLKIYQELSTTEAEIEQTKGRMQYLEGASAMATINVKLTPDELAKPLEVPGWHPSTEAKKAFETLLEFLQGLANMIIWFGILGVPVLLICGLVFFGVFKLMGLLFGRSKTPPAPPTTPTTGA